MLLFLVPQERKELTHNNKLTLKRNQFEQLI